MNGAPRKIHRKQGTKVTQVVSRPPSTPASSGGSPRRIAERAQEADELGDHDQRAGRRLGHAQAVEHLARLQPAEGLHRLLRHIGQHRVGAAEGHHRHLARRRRAIWLKTLSAPSASSSASTGAEPQRPADGADPKRPAEVGPGVLGRVLAQQPCRRRRRSLRPRPGRRRPGRPGSPAGPPMKPISAGREDDQRERNVEEEDADERRRRDARPSPPFFSARLPTRITASARSPAPPP